MVQPTEREDTDMSRLLTPHLLDIEAIDGATAPDVVADLRDDAAPLVDGADWRDRAIAAYGRRAAREAGIGLHVDREA